MRPYPRPGAPHAVDARTRIWLPFEMPRQVCQACRMPPPAEATRISGNPIFASPRVRRERRGIGSVLQGMNPRRPTRIQQADETIPVPRYSAGRFRGLRTQFSARSGHFRGLFEKGQRLSHRLGRNRSIRSQQRGCGTVAFLALSRSFYQPPSPRPGVPAGSRIAVIDPFERGSRGSAP